MKLLAKRSNAFEGYPEPKPAMSKWLYLWLIAVMAGVAGLGYVAYTSMTKQGFEPFPAACFALLIEVGTFGAGFNLVRGNRVTFPEIVVGLITSGVYNYVHIRAVNVQAVTKVADGDWLLLAVYGVGPLLIAFSAALWIGRELHRHEQAVKGWNAAATTWKLAQAEATKAAEQHAAEQERSISARLDLEKEKLRLQAENDRKRIEEEQRAKVEIAKARIEARAEAAKNKGRSSMEVPPQNKGSYQDFTNFLAGNGIDHTNRELAERFGVSTRTITEWRSKSNGKG